MASGHDERSHARFSPSQSERFTLCHGSVNLLARVPARPPSEYAIEGTRAHDVLDAALRNGERRASVAHREYSNYFFEELHNDDNFFYYSIQIALNYIYDILDAYPDAILYTERYVNPPIENAPGEAAGYCDVAICIPSTRTLYIIDYKHGAGVAKAVVGNTQVKQYAAGFLYEENAVVDANLISEVVLVIIQPRAFHPDGITREYHTTPFEIFEYLCDLDGHIAECLKPDAALTPGEDQCRFCDARTQCPAREAKALSVVGEHFRTVEHISAPKLPAPADLDIHRLGFVRMHGGMLRKWLDDIDKHCYELARSGYMIPGAKLVETQPRRKWYGNLEETAVKAAALAEVPLSEVMEYKLAPLTQVEKLVVEAFKRKAPHGQKKQAAEEAKIAFAYLTLKQSSGNVVLVDEDDERPAVNRAIDNFTQIAAVIPRQETE